MAAGVAVAFFTYFDGIGSFMPLKHCTLPLPYVGNPLILASNQTLHPKTPDIPAIRGYGNVRVMRPSTDAHNTCFALCGKLADVCAALEVMAAKEHLQSMRCAMQ